MWYLWLTLQVLYLVFTRHITILPHGGKHTNLGCHISEAGVFPVSPKMDKIEYRVVIKFFVKEGLTPNEIHSKYI